MRKRLTDICKVLLIALFVSYYSGSSFFYHTHHFTWGVVTHSHPGFPGTPAAPGHTHTPGQCNTIAHLTLLLFIAVVALFAFFSRSRLFCFIPSVRRRVALCYTPLSLLRAPPAVL